MNRLSTERRGQVVACLVEGMSIRSTVRVTGVAKNTIVKLLADLGNACAEYQDVTLRNLTSERDRVRRDLVVLLLEAEERPGGTRGTFGYGDVWTWTAIDADTKLVPSWLVGERTNRDAYAFLFDLKTRLRNNRVQITTDGHTPYLTVIEPLFGADNVDFAMLHKIYGTGTKPDSPAHTYSPPACTGIDVRIISGSPTPTGLHQLRRAPELHDADGDAPVHPTDKRVLQEGREPGPRRQPPLHALQLCPAPPDAHKRYGKTTTPAMAAG